MMTRLASCPKAGGKCYIRSILKTWAGSATSSSRDMDLLNNFGRIETGRCQGSLGLVYQIEPRCCGGDLALFQLAPLSRKRGGSLKTTGATSSARNANPVLDLAH
jgi:hypothetical protein